MEDKVKEFRDKNPILDFLAGFIPGVGEAQDAHDFIHAAKDKDYISMGLAATGLIIPGTTGGQIKKLSNVLIKKGWRETKGRIFDPQGVEYIRNKEGKLQSLSSYRQTQAVYNNEKSVYEIFGNDVIKVRSCMLLFASVSDIPIFQKMLEKHCWR